MTDWLSEGERRVDRVSAKYGLFGYEKGQRRIGVEDVNHQRVVAEAGGNGNGNGNGNEHVHQVVDRLNMLTDPSSSSSLSTPSAAAAAASITNALGAYVLVKVRERETVVKKKTSNVPHFFCIPQSLGSLTPSCHRYVPPRHYFHSVSLDQCTFPPLSVVSQ